jgi:hypothetical protein
VRSLPVLADADDKSEIGVHAPGGTTVTNPSRHAFNIARDFAVRTLMVRERHPDGLDQALVACLQSC